MLWQSMWNPGWRGRADHQCAAGERLDNAGWREFADKMTALGRNPDVNCVVIRSRGQRLPGGRRHEGARRERRPDRRAEPRLLRQLRRRLRLPGPGDRRGARLLHRRRHRHLRRRDHRDRVRGRDVRAARDRSRRARRGDASDADVRRSRRSATCSSPARPSTPRRPTAWAAIESRRCPARSCATKQWQVARSIASKSPKALRLGKGVANGIELLDVKTELPLRAGLHARALHVARQPGSPRRIRREARREVRRPKRRHREDTRHRAATTPRTLDTEPSMDLDVHPGAGGLPQGGAQLARGQRARASRWLRSTRRKASRPTAPGSASSTRAASRWCPGPSSTAAAAPTCSSG